MPFNINMPSIMRRIVGAVVFGCLGTRAQDQNKYRCEIYHIQENKRIKGHSEYSTFMYMYRTGCLCTQYSVPGGVVTQQFQKFIFAKIEKKSPQNM